MFASIIIEYIRGVMEVGTNRSNILDSRGNLIFQASQSSGVEAAAQVAAAAEVLPSEQLLARGREAMATALQRLRHPGPWALEARAAAGDADAVVESCRLPGCRGKVFRLTATLPECAPGRVWERLLEDSSRSGWLLAEARTIQALDGASMDVQLQVSAARLGGLVAPRQFLLVRHWSALPGGARALASASTHHPAAPEPSWSAPRAVCGPGGWLVEPAPRAMGTRMRWAVDCALAGWLPASAADAACASYMLAYAAYLHACCHQHANSSSDGDGAGC